VTSIHEEAQSPPLYGKGNRWAILVGINDYSDKNYYGTLSVCVDDALKIREALIAGGFERDRIHLLTDKEKQLPLREEIIAELHAVADVTEFDDLLLFYFSGHGVEKDGEGYLVPLNAKGIAPRDTAVSIRLVKEIMEQANARAKVMILDACHAGAKIRAKGPSSMSEEFIKNVFEQAEGMAIISSCSREQFSYEWPEKRSSVFTSYFLEALQGLADYTDKGFVTVLDVNGYVTDGVKRWASQHQVSQVPTLNYLVSGDILLVIYEKQTRTSKYISTPLFTSARNYLTTVQNAVGKALDVFSREQVEVADCQPLTQSLRQINQPAFFETLRIHSLTDSQFHPLSLALHAIDDQKNQALSLISTFGQDSQATRKKITGQKKVINGMLTSLLKEIADASTLVGSLEKSPNATEGKIIPMQQRSNIDKYVGGVQALGEGRVNEELTNQLVDIGVHPKKDAMFTPEDILERFRKIPLHAIFLYTSEDQEVGDYIAKNWGALETLSGNVCDIHPMVNQFRGAEDAYDYIERLDVVRDAGFREYTKLPGIFFHDNYGASEYISFGEKANEEQIKRTIRVVFEEIRRHPTISAVTHSRQLLEDRSLPSTMKKEYNPKKSNLWSDLFAILFAFVVIVAGFIALAHFVSPLVLWLIIIGALLFFILIISWLLRRSDELSESNFVKIVLRTFNALPLLKDKSQKDEHKD
jgi:uncharacterized caspase-like protein